MRMSAVRSLENALCRTRLVTGTNNPTIAAAVTATTTPEPTVSVAEAAGLLGVSAATVRRRCATSDLFSLAVSGAYRIPRYVIEHELRAATAAAPTAPTAPAPAPDDPIAVAEMILGAAITTHPPLLWPEKAAAMLQLRPEVVRRMMDEGELPAVRIWVRRRMIPTAAVYRLVATGSAA